MHLYYLYIRKKKKKIHWEKQPYGSEVNNNFHAKTFIDRSERVFMLGIKIMEGELGY